MKSYKFEVTIPAGSDEFFEELDSMTEEAACNHFANVLQTQIEDELFFVGVTVISKNWEQLELPV